MDNPRYVIFALLDEPKGNKSTWNFATGGWVAAPVVAQVIKRMAPLYGLAPRDEGGKPEAPRSITHKPSVVAATEPDPLGAMRARQLAAN